MEPNRFGKTLGIGMRVASRMVRQRAQGGSTVQSAAGRADTAAKPSKQRPAMGEPARRLGEGTRRFGRAVFEPMAHTGVTLWLEITGLFFALFGLFFAQNAWKLRSAFRVGPEHGHFVVYALLTVFFLYFSATSFLRSRQRSRRRASER